VESTIKWTSIKESLPKAEERVLFWAEYERGGAAGYGYKAEDDEDSVLWRDESYVDRDGDIMSDADNVIKQNYRKAAAMLVTDQLMLDQEKRIADAVFNATTFTPVDDFLVTDINVDSMYSAGRFTCPSAGIWMVGGCYAWTSITDGNRFILGLRINSTGSLISRLLTRGTVGGTNIAGGAGVVPLNLALNDTVDLMGWVENATTGFNDTQQGYQYFYAYKISD